MLYANTEGQLQAMLNALFILVKGWRVCTRDDGVSGEGRAINMGSPYPTVLAKKLTKHPMVQ